MFSWVNRIVLMIGMAIAGLGLLTAPILIGPSYAPAELISGVIGAVMILVAVGLGYGSVEWWSRFALGIGTWSMVAPLALGFYYQAPPFWAHLAAGFVALVIGVAGHELVAGDSRAGQLPTRAPAAASQHPASA
jgi:hypothetical protein